MADTSGVTIVIQVGDDQNELIFDPNEVIADIGDIVQFEFMSGNHSVVKGDFANPCVPAGSGGFYSGFIPAAVGEASGSISIFSLTIHDTAPIAYYCAQGRHCQNGMVGVINPSGDNDFANYVAAAASAPSNVVPGVPTTTRSGTSSRPTTPSYETSSARTSQPQSQTSQSSYSTGGPAQPNPTADGDSSFSRGAQVGIGIGVAVVLVVIGMLGAAWFLFRRRRRQRGNRMAAAPISMSHQKLEFETLPVGSRDKLATQVSISPQKSELEAPHTGNRDRPPLGQRWSGSVYELDGEPPL